MPEYRPTSERISEDDRWSTPGEYLTYLFHVATYSFAEQYTPGARVLDMGCGTGYGAHRLAATAATVTGVDISPDAIGYAQAHYRQPNLTYHLIKPVEEEPLPFDANSFDVVTSFQVIEHVPSVASYIAEIRRALTPDGVFVCATPDRSTRLFRGQRPWNMYHLHEYLPDELRETLETSFEDVEVLTMSAPPAVIQLELRRARRTRILTYPFTFPGAPEGWRQAGLRMLKALQAKAPTAPPGGDATEPAFGFDESAIAIAADAQPSVNIVTVARGPGGAG